MDYILIIIFSVWTFPFLSDIVNFLSFFCFVIPITLKDRCSFKWKFKPTIMLKKINLLKLKKILLAHFLL